MKLKISIYLLIAIVVFVKSDEDVTTKKVETLLSSSPSTISSTITTTTSSSSSSDSLTKDTKEKRQLDHHQTAIHPNHHHQQHHHHNSHHQSSVDPIYSSSQANNFVIRAYNNGINRRPHSANHQHHQYLRESSQPVTRVQSQSQPEPVQEAAQQQYVYLPENARGQQQQIFRPAHYSKQGPIRKPQAIRPVQLIQDIPQYAPHPYPLIPEDQLLKLLEEELANKGITNIQQNHQQPLEQQQQPQQLEQKIIQTQSRKPSAQQQHAVAESQPQPGLGNYRQGGPDNLEYVYLQQQQQPAPQAQQYYAAPYLQHRSPQLSTLNQQQNPSLYPSSQTPLDYHRNIPNHPLAASSLEKEIEKLFAPKKPKNIYEQPQSQLRYASLPQYQAYKNSKPPAAKSYGTTPSPTEKQYSFLPSLAEFSGFKQEESPELELPEQKTRQYLPKPYPTRSEYVKENNLANKQLRRPKPQIQPTSLYHLPKVQQQPQIQFYSPIQQQQQHHHHSQISQSEFVPITNPNHSKNSVMKLIDPPSLQYDKQKISSPTLYYNHDEQQQQQQSPQGQHLISPVAHPSHSSIYVSQGSGHHHSTTPQPSHQIKSSYGGTDDGERKNEIRLPPPNGKPITQEEFQALVDAGYPVQAVPVPVPVPYEKYIKDHPEYKNQIQEQQQQTSASNHHNSRTVGSITYLHPIRDQQNEDEYNEKST